MSWSETSFSWAIAAGSNSGSIRVLALAGSLSVREKTTFSAVRQIAA